MKLPFIHPQADLAAQILNRARARKGQMVGFLWSRPMKTRKGITAPITKEVRTVCRVGLDYDNQKAVEAKRANGELPSENAGLPWGKWVMFPYLLEHKGNLFLRAYPLPNHKAKVTYRNGSKIVKRDDIKELCLAEEFKERETNCLTVNLSHVRRMR